MTIDVFGTSLVKFCKEKDLPYAKIWYRVTVKGMNIAEAINDVERSTGKPRYCRHWINGMTLRQYCLQNNINYVAMIAKMGRTRRTAEQLLKH